MYRSSRLCSLGAALLVLSAAAAPVLAAAPASAGSAPFSAEITHVFVGFEQGFGIFVGAGRATQMGPVTAESRNFSTANGRRHRGTTVVTAASGDTLLASYQLEQTGEGVWEGTFTFDGGTGRFEGASGGGEWTLILVEPGVVSGTYEGTLSL